MAKKVKIIAVDYNFFNKVFEPERQRIQKKLGLSNLSQTKFTELIANDKMFNSLNKKLKRKKYEKFNLF